MPTLTPPVEEISIIASPVSDTLLPKAKRVASVDVYRGFVMLLMMAEVLQFEKVSKAVPSSGFWRFMAFNQSHVPWVGCSLHDLIQPSFSFLVGVAVPYSIAGRLAKGAQFSHLLRHTIVRSLILILLGIFLRSMHATQTNFTFEDTLTQIGLGYTFLFLLGFASARAQVIWLAIILIGYWTAFAFYPLPGAGFDYAAAAVPPNWENNLQGFAAHWNKNTNLAMGFDQWFLNLFPREKPFVVNSGGYATLSFIPTLGTRLLGLMAGNTLRKFSDNKDKLKRLIIPGVILIVASLLIHVLGINPIVKRIWTPNWVLFSGGICFLLLALFYVIIDVYQIKKWSFPLMVIGVNSIAAYVFAHTIDSFIASTMSIHLGNQYNQFLGVSYSTLVSGTLILFFEILILWWMYRKKIFIKI